MKSLLVCFNLCRQWLSEDIIFNLIKNISLEGTYLNRNRLVHVNIFEWCSSRKIKCETEILVLNWKQVWLSFRNDNSEPIYIINSTSFNVMRIWSLTLSGGVMAWAFTSFRLSSSPFLHPRWCLLLQIHEKLNYTANKVV